MADNTPRAVQSIALTKDEKQLIFLVHFEANGAKITPAASAAETTPGTVYKWMSEDDEFRTAVMDIRDRRVEERLDLAEDMLDFNILKGQSSDIQFILKTLGKHRGYGTKVAITGPNGGSIFDGLEWPDEPESLEAWSRETIDAEVVEPKQIEEGGETNE